MYILQLVVSTIIISQIKMISRMFKIVSPLKKQILSPFTLHKNRHSQIKYCFSDENKKTNKKGDDKDQINAQMNPLEQGRRQGDKVQGQDGIESSKFGNTMLLASAIALALAYAYMQIQVMRANKKKKPDSALVKQTSSGKAQIGGEWELKDTEGKTFGSKDLQGTYYLIYFGFTHCPDICPNSLTKLSKAVARLKKTKDAKFFNLKTIFVSVDPDRDTPQKIKKFMSIFDPQMIGVTGSHNQDPILRQCMKKFKIYASKLEFQDENSVQKGRKSYTIDHTILTYLMSDTNEYITHLGANLGEHDLSNLILQKIEQDKREKMQKLKL